VPTLRIIDLAEYRGAIGGGGIVVVELVRAIIGQLDLILRFVKILRFAQDDRGRSEDRGALREHGGPVS